MTSTSHGLQVLICDDSPLARKQMARALPPEWPVQVLFATNGREGLEKIRAGGIDVLFLDLNMPEMNGYEVLHAIHSEDLPCMTLVVSGDVQPQARRWAQDHGALDFISKPVVREQLRAILLQFGLLQQNGNPEADRQFIAELPQPEFLDVIREVVNVAMGQAGSQLGELLDAFITLPVPRVHQTVYADLISLLAFQVDTRLHAVSQGFSARGLSGEAILLMKRDDLERLRMPYNAAVPHQEDDSVEGELVDDRLLSTLVDVCGLLAGSCLRGMSTQFDLEFNHGYPVILGRNQSLQALIGDESAGQKVLVVEMCYTLEDNIACDLLIAFTEDSIPVLEQRAAWLRQDSDEDDRESRT